jgi:hypothetical protein
MYPYKVRVIHSINQEFNQTEIADFLIYFKEILRSKGADRVRIENNCLNFDNYFFKIASNWNILSSLDAGELEINSIENETKFKYSIRIINNWIVILLVCIMAYFSSKDLNVSLILFVVLNILHMLTPIRHYYFLKSRIKEFIQEKKKMNTLT